MKIYKIILIISLFYSLFSCNSDNKKKSYSGKNKDEPSLHIQGFCLTETLEGVKQWELKGEYADIYENKDLINIKKIEMLFYSSTEQYFSHLWAEDAELNTKTKDIFARNKVKVISRNNIELETEKLTWNVNNQVFETDVPVKIVKKDSVLTGVGLKTNSGLENIKILNNVKVVTKERILNE
ncbi:MAG: LPS export ABC transporter periplasmic protein LptC [Candidatus Firestonebacteria bacterium]|nr:LPS export ABC transporter periplasmic protein LptC [Candidatus Firestonebacteria bacterium]